ncbi:MAG: GAF domain-containing protein [Breznakia sp.]
MNITLQQYKALCEDIKEEISLLANTTAFLNDILDDVSWVGFYLRKNDNLVLGPFQGKIACTSINFGKGVCGTVAQTKKTLRVSDVHQFDGHIACDSASNSEIVVAIIVHDELYGVLDLDSTSFSRFKEQDQILLEAIVALLAMFLENIKH